MNFSKKMLTLLMVLSTGALVIAKKPIPARAQQRYNGGEEEQNKTADYSLAKVRDNAKKTVAFQGTGANQKFTPNFVLSNQDWVKRNELGKDVFKMLLQTGRDSQAKYTGNDQDDLKILNNINASIEALVNKFPNNSTN
jgi:glycine cleavage system pyridoxal-binding protein P